MHQLVSAVAMCVHLCLIVSNCVPVSPVGTVSTMSTHDTMHYVSGENMGIGIFPPQHPFSPGIIISDKIIGGCPLSSFTIDIYLDQN